MLMLMLCKNALKIIGLPREAGGSIKVDIYDNNLRKVSKLSANVVASYCKKCEHFSLRGNAGPD